MVCGSSMSQSVAGFSGPAGPSPRHFQSRMQVVVLPRAGLAELADLERKGEAALLVKRGKVLLQHLEQPIAGGAQHALAAAGTDLERGMDVGRIRAAVGNAPGLRGKRPHPDAAERIDAPALGIALRGQ